MCDDLRELVLINRKRRRDDFLNIVFYSFIVGPTQYITRGITKHVIEIGLKANITHIALARLIRSVIRFRGCNFFICDKMVAFCYRWNAIILIQLGIIINIDLKKLVCFSYNTHDESVLHDFDFGATVNILFRSFLTMVRNCIQEIHGFAITHRPKFGIIVH